VISDINERLCSAKAFIFDFYGTLVEDDVAVPEMWQSLNMLGYNSSPELQAIFEPDAFDGHITPTFRSTPSHDDWIQSNWRQFVQHSGVPHELVQATLAQLLKQQQRFKAKSVPSASSVLSLLRSHDRKIGLCSNWESPIWPFLQDTGLPEFDAISISAEVGARKPHAAIFCDVCSKLGVEPDQAIFVGDNWSADIVGALRSGLVPVWIRRDRGSRNLPHLVAEFDTLAELASYLRAIILKASSCHETKEIAIASSML
jgi:HAD superfamily hydrolase (TIGR01509 family)